MSQLLGTQRVDDAVKLMPGAMLDNSTGNRKVAAKDTVGAASVVKAICANPESLLKRDEKLTSQCRVILGQVYAQQTAAVFGAKALKMQFAPRNKKQAGIPLGPLVRLGIDLVYDSEQLWEEMEMRNEAFCEFARTAVKQQKTIYTQQLNASKDESNSSQVTEAIAKELPVSILKRPRQSDATDTVRGSSGDDDTTEQYNVVQHRVRFADALESDVDSVSDSNEESENEEKSKEKPESSKTPKDLEDGFFSLADMEAFADEAETLAIDGKLMATDDVEEDDEDEVLKFKKPSSEESEGRQGLRYDEFFAPPANENMDEENARALKRANLFDTGSDEESAEGGDAEEQTPLQRSRAEIRKTIEVMEDAAVGKKPWELRGEVHGDARPKNSALDSNFEHDIALQNRAKIAPQSAEVIEDIIKKRIVDRLFDDVVRPLPRDYEEAKNSKKELPAVSQEKPTEGLGDVYAREYLEQREKLSKAAEAADVVTKEEGPEETELQKEVNTLFSKLCTKLDALTSLHFTPTGPTIPEEMTVKPNVPALAAEEAIPEAVSDAALLAPHEVHKANKKEKVGELEKIKNDRRRSRRATKKRLASLTKERTVVQTQKEQADPLLAEKRRAERALDRRGKKLKPSKKSDLPGGRPKSGDYSRSNRFFSQLQDTVTAEISAKKPNAAATENNHKSAAELKL